MSTPRRPDPAPLATDDVRSVAIGTALWAVVWAVLAVFARGFLDHHDATWWLYVPPAGIVLGLLGVRFCQRRAAAIARDAELGLPQRE